MTGPSLMEAVFKRLEETGFNRTVSHAPLIIRAHYATSFTQMLQTGHCVMIRFVEYDSGRAFEIRQLPKKV